MNYCDTQHTVPAEIQPLLSTLCFDAAGLDEGFYRLLRAKDVAIRDTIERLLISSTREGWSTQEDAAIWRTVSEFFHRFYQDGYPIVSLGPPKGQDVYLDWIHRGQHYAKTGEQFHNNTFCVKIATKKICVHLVVQTAQLTRRPLPKRKQAFFFPLLTQASYDAQSQTLVLPFAYRFATPGELTRYGTGWHGQECILQAWLRQLPSVSPLLLRQTLTAIPSATLLKHVRAFIRHQRGDYFIPVHLEQALERALTWYLLKYVLPPLDVLQEMEDTSGPQRLCAGVQKIGLQLIETLAKASTMENRLFEKRPFVLRVDYLVPLEHISRHCWPTILANQAQLAAWHTLFGLPRQLDEATLELHPTLIIDTRHFDEAFKNEVLASFPDRDSAIDGIVIDAENYRALRFLEPRFREQVRMIYIDPPYSTGGHDFPYKDDFTHSTWLTMMEERLKLAWDLLADDGVICVSIDDHEFYHLRYLLDELCGEEHFVASIVWRRAYGSKSSAKHLAVVHEYIVIYAKGNPSRFYPPLEPATDPATSHPTENGWSTEQRREDDLFLTSTMWSGSEVGYSATGTKELRAMFRYEHAEEIFPTVKPISLLRRLLRLATIPGRRDLVLDFFAGSGSTAHALIHHNREDGGDRRFVLVEQSHHVETTLLPRIIKAMYCPSWKDGCPQDYPSPDLFGWPEWVKKTPRLVQILRLESYEDSLHNLVLADPTQQIQKNSSGEKEVKEEHALCYQAILPLRNTSSLLEREAFDHPFSTTLEVLTDTGPHVERIDLVETCNALFGLCVERTECWIDPETSRSYLAVVGARQQRRVLVLWREHATKDHAREYAFLKPRIQPFDLVLINGEDQGLGINMLTPILRTLMEVTGEQEADEQILQLNLAQEA